MSDKNLRIRPEIWKRAQAIVGKLGHGLAVPTLLHHAIAVYLANAEEGDQPQLQNGASSNRLLEHNLQPAALDRLASRYNLSRTKLVTEIILNALIPNAADRA
jgi:hypothetical protein